MAARDEEDPVIAEWVVFRNLTGAGRSADAVALSERIVAESVDPRRVAQALIERLVSHINMSRLENLGPLLDEIDELLRQAPDLRLLGEFNTMAGQVAYERGSLGIALLRLVTAERYLRRMNELSLAAVDAWHDLAATYSSLGYHAKALSASRNCQRLAAAAGLAPNFGFCLQAQVGAAVHLDQRGDTAGCVRDLRAVVATGRPVVDDLVVMELVTLRYAVQRLAALGHPGDLEVPEHHDVDAQLAQINHLAAVCLAIAEEKPDHALALLDLDLGCDAFGAAEPLRLRSIALAQRGDHAAALESERNTMKVITTEENQLRGLLVSVTGARLDQERLRQMAAQYADQAVTDPLTGLPNRRQVATFAAALTKQNRRAMFGVLDLDGFKAVNDTHGHPSGDLVLQRVAGIFARSVRQGDLLARHGGDEFVVILPGATEREAGDVGTRIQTAVGAEDWDSLVPGTPVGVSLGWAELTGDTEAALRAADKALYQAKREREEAARRDEGPRRPTPRLV